MIAIIQFNVKAVHPDEVRKQAEAIASHYDKVAVIGHHDDQANPIMIYSILCNEDYMRSEHTPNLGAKVN